ncbi:MAG: hypothetical protein KGJ07_00250 [Patescibacteria group bacterium]|nr:hypothetical protein [Patescibacteria group bacterium]
MNLLTDLEGIAKQVIKYSPTLATMILGPAGGAVATLIAGALGVNPSDSSAIINGVNTDPDIKAKLLAIEDDLQKFKSQNSMTDTENARQFQIDEEKEGKTDYMPIIITVFLMITFVGVLLLLFFPVSTSQQNSTLIGTMTGLLTREFIQACRYYIGGDSTDS